jgi:hypothetical protein
VLHIGDAGDDNPVWRKPFGVPGDELPGVEQVLEDVAINQAVHGSPLDADRGQVDLFHIGDLHLGEARSRAPSGGLVALDPDIRRCGIEAGVFRAERAGAAAALDDQARIAGQQFQQIGVDPVVIFAIRARR